MGDEVDLGTLTIVLVFTGEVFTLKPIEDFCDRFGRFGEHGLERHTGLEFAIFVKVGEAVGENGGNDDFVARQFAV